MDLFFNGNKVTIELKKFKEIDDYLFSKFMDTTDIHGKAYFKVPVTLDIDSKPTELFRNVIVTMRTKKVMSANDYKFETYGY